MCVREYERRSQLASEELQTATVRQLKLKGELAASRLAMLQAQIETYGDGLDNAILNPYAWTWKPHYYRAGLSFYNYPYAFGLLFGTGLYATYQQRGSAFVEDYKNLLASTGEASAADLAARFGIDIRSQSFWTASLAQSAALIERYESLIQLQIKHNQPLFQRLI